MKEYLFGEPRGKHKIIVTLDQDAAIWRFLTEGASLRDYVPEKYVRCDPEGRWMGYYDSHMEMFIREYSPDACVPVYEKEDDTWKLVGNVPFKTGGRA